MGWVKRVPFRSHSGSITAGALFALTHPPYTSGALGVAGAEAGDRQFLMCNSQCDLAVLISIAGAFSAQRAVFSACTSLAWGKH